MKIVKNVKLNESKEKIPTSVITDLVSRAWEEIGLIKANIDQLGKAYSGVSKLTDTFEDLLDSYLIYVGQLEAFLADNNLIDYPEEKDQINEKLELTEDVYASTVIERKPINIAINESNASKSVDALLDADTEDNLEDAEEEIKDEADFFVDFDEPDLSEPKLTDEDVYGKQ